MFIIQMQYKKITQKISINISINVLHGLIEKLLCSLLFKVHIFLFNIKHIIKKYREQH